MLTQERLKQLFYYDKDTGLFIRKIKASKRTVIGEIAGTKHSRGYLQIGIDGKKYFTHCLAWLYIHGSFPTDDIDHINGSREDNRIVNLREASNAENCQNRKKRKSKNTSQYIGVSWNKTYDKWHAQISFNGKNTSIGFFSSEKEAANAYIAHKRIFHPFCTI